MSERLWSKVVLSREIVFGSGLRLPAGTPVAITAQSHDGQELGLTWRESESTSHSFPARRSDILIISPVDQLIDEIVALRSGGPPVL